MNDEMIAQILRNQAWERAKAELQCMVVTFYGNGRQLNLLTVEIDAFVAKIEGDGLQE